MKSSVSPDTIERHSRPVRWFHAFTYVSVLLLLGTGWWLAFGQEGRPSVAARWTGIPDTELHLYAGWALAALALFAATIGARAAIIFLRESARTDPGDMVWFKRWPVASFTGRFARHEGLFDPGQRLANLVLLVLLSTLIITGVGLTLITGGPMFVWLQQLHKWATYLITPVLLGHILVASGVLPGYRGVARSMHLGGRLPVRVARRVWPGWLERRQSTKRRTDG